MAKTAKARGTSRGSGEGTVEGASMSVESARLFDVELPEAIAAAARKVEGLCGQPIDAGKSKEVDVGRIVGFYDDGQVPRILAAPRVKPTLSEVAIEVLRLELRDRITEERMPYAEMRHAENKRLCRWLYRVMEQEILLPIAQSGGVAARKDLQDRLIAEMLDPLEQGKYRPKEAEPGRARAATLDGLELLVSYVDPEEAQAVLCRIASIDEGIASKLGLLYKVVENNRPFDDVKRVRAAYYLSVPFLFDTRRPTRPKIRIK